MPVKPWFAPKRYGYGAGWPIAWQGWAALATYIGVVAIAATWLREPGRMAVVFVATAILIVVCKHRTAGGWRWRRGRIDR